MDCGKVMKEDKPADAVVSMVENQWRDKARQGFEGCEEEEGKLGGEGEERIGPTQGCQGCELAGQTQEPRKRRRSVLHDGQAERSENVVSRQIKEDADMKKYSPWSRLEQLSIINFQETHGGFSLRKTGKILEKFEEM